MPTIDLRAATLDLYLEGGSDVEIRLFISNDENALGGTARGFWIDSITYDVGDIVEDSAVFYRAVASTLNEVPAATPGSWLALEAFDLTGFTDWQAQVRDLDGQSVPFTIDDSEQASSIIKLSLDPALVNEVLDRGQQRWSLKVTDTLGKVVTLFLGSVNVEWNPTQ